LAWHAAIGEPPSLPSSASVKALSACQRQPCCVRHAPSGPPGSLTIASHLKIERATGTNDGGRLNAWIVRSASVL